MKKIAFHVFLAILAIIVCYYGAAFWQLESEEERTVNLAEMNPEQYPRMCELHNLEMQWDRVAISHGRYGIGPNMKGEFPHSNKWVDNMTGGFGPYYALVRFCPKCREAETVFDENWRKQIR